MPKTLTYPIRPERLKIAKLKRLPYGAGKKQDYADVFDPLLGLYFTDYQREYRFAAMAAGGIGPGVRARLAAQGWHDWRFDFAFAGEKLAIEIDGGNRGIGWTANNQPIPIGRHTTAADYEKLNAANVLGWHVLRYTIDMINASDLWVTQVYTLLGGKHVITQH